MSCPNAVKHLIVQHGVETCHLLLTIRSYVVKTLTVCTKKRLILAACVQNNWHPLDRPSIARLTPLHDKTSRLWTLSNNIITPIGILQQLGVEDFHYDAWGLQIIWTRVINNQEEHHTPDGRQVRAINPLYSLFNHSCEPNIGWKSH